MKKMKKMMGIAFCAAMLMSAAPISGSFVMPTVVKASYGLTDGEYTNLKAVGIGYNQLEISGVEDIINNYNHYQYIWVKNATLYRIKEAFKANKGTALKSPNGNKIVIDGPTDLTNNSDLVIVKTEGTDFSQDSIPIKGKYFEFSRADKPNANSVKFDENGDIVGVNGLEWKTFLTDKDPETDNDTQTSLAQTGKQDGGYETLSKNRQEVSVPSNDDTRYENYLFRTKGGPSKFASEAFSISVFKIKSNNLATLKYKYNHLSEKLSITGDSIKNTFKGGKNRGEVKVKITRKDGSSEEKKFTLKAQKGIDFDVLKNPQDGDKVEFYVGDYVANQDPNITFEKIATPVAEIKAIGKKLVGFGDDGGNHIYKKEGDSDYTKATSNEAKDLKAGVYLIHKIGGQDEAIENIADSNSPNTGVICQIKSDSKEVKVTGINYELLEQALAEEAAAEEAKKKAEEAKKEEEKKTEETKKEEEKKTEETKKEEEKKTEETKQAEQTEENEPLTKVIENVKKTSVTATVETVQEVLTANDGTLILKAKSVSVGFSKNLLLTTFGEKPASIKISAKSIEPKKGSKEEKKIAKIFKKNKSVSNKIYTIAVKLGDKTINNFNLQGEKVKITLNTDLKKNIKNLYVMNIGNKKLMKASVKAGKVTFKTGKVGKFVLVTK